MKLLQAIATMALGLTVGCDPCTGLSNCGALRAVHVEGRVLDPADGSAISGAGLTIALEGGVARSTQTSNDGLFAATIPVATTGAFRYELELTPPADSATVIRNLVCEVSDTAWAGCPIGRIVSRPYFWDFARVEFRDAEGAIVPNTRVVFRRTGGARIYDTSGTIQTVTTGTDPFGNVLMFGLDIAVAGDVVPLVGDLIVRLPAPFDSTVLRDFVLRPRVVFPEPIPPYLLQVGPALRSAFRFYRGDTTNPAAGVDVRFVRTGGIEIGTTGLSGTTGADGRTTLRPRPLTRGQVTGDVIVQPPAPAQGFVISGITLTTFDDDSTRLVLSRDLLTAQATQARRGSPRR